MYYVQFVCTGVCAVAEPQAGEIKLCVSFCGAKLSRMVADLRKPQKFNPAKVKAYTVPCPSQSRYTSIVHAYTPHSVSLVVFLCRYMETHCKDFFSAEVYEDTGHVTPGEPAPEVPKPSSPSTTAN